MISGLPCRCDNILVSFFKKKLHNFLLCQFCLYLNQIWYQDVPYIPCNACQIWRLSDYVFDFMTVFCKCAKRSHEDNEQLFEGLHSRNSRSLVVESKKMTIPRNNGSYQAKFGIIRCRIFCRISYPKSSKLPLGKNVMNIWSFLLI